MTAAAPNRMTPAHATPAGHAPLSVSEGHCINLRGRQDACDLCQRRCPSSAISLSLDEIAIDSSLCVGCGACVPACPAGAFVHHDFDPEDFVARASGRKSLRIGCVQASGKAPGRTFAVPCHRMLDARLLAALFAEGVERIKLAGTESCGDCPSGDARRDLAAAIRTLGSWFGDSAPEVVTAQPDAPETGGGAGASRASERRRLLRGAFASLSHADAEGRADPARALPSFDSLLATDDGGEEAVARPVPYQQVLALRRGSLPFREDGPVGATGRVISEECSGCLVCADLCPTGALDSEVTPGRRLVSFDPANCTNCTLCLKVCPMKAISARALRGVAAAETGRTALFLRRDSICAMCGHGFDVRDGNGEALCPQCRNERDMNDEWEDMLGG